ncbi:MAG TPA: hypothetical protein VLT90_16490 [Terriglobales bacterium]|nr:hypothetical protein [Terriglobales bacterium]
MTKLTFADLWRPSGTVDRTSYALVGLLGFALKHNLDRLIATFGFHRQWTLFNYWLPLRDVARITSLRSAEGAFLATMVAFALPFVWVGTVLTTKRLRSAGLPASLVLLFFVPFLNLIFFLMLCLWPARSQATGGPPQPAGRASIARLLPESAFGSAALSLLMSVPIGLGIAMIGVRVLIGYGWGLFVAMPFTMGFIAALIYGYRQPRSLGSCVGVGALSVALVGLALFVVAAEGILCLAMAIPIALPLAALGGSFGYWVQRARWVRQGGPAVISVALLFAPSVQWMEHSVAPRAPEYVVRSSIDVQAPPEKVWKEVVAFTEIPAPKEWLFRSGIAYPIRAEIRGMGAGAERRCVFSTGAFVEPIQIWDAPHSLKFSVTSNPAPMEEWTLYSHIEPPHLHGFLVSNGGQFLLTPLPDGGTRLEGTTWYHHGLWPAQYWRLWSDAIIHRIHMRVLTHIREAAEHS